MLAPGQSDLSTRLPPNFRWNCLIHRYLRSLLHVTLSSIATLLFDLTVIFPVPRKTDTSRCCVQAKFCWIICQVNLSFNLFIWFRFLHLRQDLSSPTSCLGPRWNPNSMRRLLMAKLRCRDGSYQHCSCKKWKVHIVAVEVRAFASH